MTRLARFSEQFGANGNLAGEGALNTLGRPPIDPLTIMIRESVQNSWDARLQDVGLRYSVDGLVVDESVRRVLKEQVFADLPVLSKPGDLELAQTLAREPLHLLALSDRGSIGLGGPTRADEITDPTTPRDFVDFLRNIGEPPDPTRPTGGTYGYGKAALYLASSAHTLIVYTRSREPSGLQSRLIATAIGSRYIRPDGHFKGRYTGRHWWGVLRDAVAEPVIDAAADELAEALGLPGFQEDETGTTIVILDPMAEPSLDRGAMSYIVESLLWFFWPKMLPQGGPTPPIGFSASFDHQVVPIPEPADFPPLGLFVRAFQEAKAFTGEVNEAGRHVSAVYRHSQRLGVVALNRAPYVSRVPIRPQTRSYPVPVQYPASHVALMRQPELVVRYLAGPPLPSDDFEYGGVFIAANEVDKVFAASEPPAHDDWVPNVLESTEAKGYVRVALRKVATAMAEFSAPAGVALGGEGDAVPLGEFSDELAMLIPTAEGTGAGPADHAGGARGNTQRARVVQAGSSEFMMIDGAPSLLMPFLVRHRPGSPGSVVRASATVVLDDGSLESQLDVPANAPVPEVIGWLDPNGVMVREPQIVVTADSVGAWKLVTSVAAEAALGLSIDAEPIETEGI